MKPTVKKSRPVAKKEGVKRKTRAELNIEGRDRKRQKKHKGNVAGQRTNHGAGSVDNRSPRQVKDPRSGSKKPVPLFAEEAVSKKGEVPVETTNTVKMSAREELTQLENSEKLDLLLESLEQGETLTTDDKRWLDTTLDRIEELMLRLGIDIEEADDDEKQEDMYRLLKGQ